MPPKGAYTLERAQQFGVAAAESARARHANEGVQPCGQLTCEYRGVVTSDGAYNIHERIAYRSSLVYEWHACVFGYDEKTLIHVKCGHAADQGVPFPNKIIINLKI